MFKQTDFVPTTEFVEKEEKDQARSDWKALFLFNLYRFTVATIFLGAMLANVAPSFLGQADKRLFLISCWCYLGFAFASVFIIKHRWLTFHVQVVGQLLVDVVMITLLMHASGGVNSGLGMLFIVATAGGSLLTGGRTALFFAAMASLCVLIEVTWGEIVYYDLSLNNYTHAGLLGISFFATALLAHTLARRVRISEALAKQRGVHLQYLAQLNAQIVQQIQTGIIVIDMLGRIRLFNEAAHRLLGLNEQPNERLLNSLAPELSEQVEKWKSNRTKSSLLFRPNNGEVDVIASFTELNRGYSVNILIMLEDATVTAQRAQQLKLASLGRLTATIAHEIRNPLSAISHAGQLLAESPGISPQETRLTEIIANHSQRVNTIIENVLQLSRREQANTQGFNLPPWLQSFLEEFINQHNLKPQDIIFKNNYSELMVYFDPNQLYQVLGNLCENGLRYSQKSPLLEITVGISEESKRAYLDVRDYGIGMTKEVTAQIFEPFFTTEIKGTGLGLYLAREICEANQAALHLLTNSNEGCCFRIHFSSLPTDREKIQQ